MQQAVRSIKQKNKAEAYLIFSLRAITVSAAVAAEVAAYVTKILYARLYFESHIAMLLLLLYVHIYRGYTLLRLRRTSCYFLLGS